MIELQVLSPVVGEGACKQALNNVDGFRQALVTLAPPGPAGADDVLVQALSGPQSQREPVVAEQPQRGGALRDDGRMVAHGRTRDRRHQADPPRRLGQRAQYGPGQRRMPLLFEPGKEVIGNGREVETRLLGTLGIAYQVGGAVLLGHELVAELEHC